MPDHGDFKIGFSSLKTGAVVSESKTVAVDIKYDPVNENSNLHHLINSWPR